MQLKWRQNISGFRFHLREKNLALHLKIARLVIHSLVRHVFVYDFRENCARQRISEENFIKTSLVGDLWPRNFWELSDDTIRPEAAANSKLFWIATNEIHNYSVPRSLAKSDFKLRLIIDLVESPSTSVDTYNYCSSFRYFIGRSKSENSILHFFPRRLI